MVRNGVSAPPEPGLGGARAGLIILSLSAFAAVTTEMAPVGLLPAIGHAFGVAESTAGLLVSLYAVLVAALAVPLTLATKRVPGKRLLLVAMSSYTVSNVISALAPSLAVLAVGRAVGGVTHALFFSVFIGYATRLVPPAQTGRALALASVGVPAGFVLGVPLATALGNAAGWRAAFFALAALTAVVGVLVAVMLPDVRSQADERRPAPGRLRQMVAVIGSNTLVFLGQYTLYTYVSVLLLRSGASSRAVGPILLVFGVFGLIGVWSAGPRLDRHLRGSCSGGPGNPGRGDRGRRSGLSRAGAGDRRGRCLERRLRGGAVRLPDGGGAHAGHVAGAGRGMDQRILQRRHRRRCRPGRRCSRKCRHP